MAIALLAVFALVSSPLTARAEGEAEKVAIKVGIAKDGAVTVEQTFTFKGDAPSTFEQRLSKRRGIMDDREYRYQISDVKATAGGKDLAPTVDDGGDTTVITANTEGVTEPVTVSYTVKGAAVNVDDATAVQWPVVQGLNFPVGQVTGEIGLPGLFRYLRCTAGAPNSTDPCQMIAGGTEYERFPEFRHGALGAGQMLALDIGFDPKVVAANEEVHQNWTIGRAFSVAPLPLGIAAAILALGAIALYLLHRRAGSDAPAGSDVVQIAEFHPVGDGASEFRVLNDVRPGHVGTVADERVDPIDVTASLLDLAIRKHLVIEELPRETEFAPTDWVFHRVDGPTDDLPPFEVELLDAVAPAAADTPVKVSTIGPAINESIGRVQSALYDEVVDKGWYERRPDDTRSAWNRWGFALLGLGIVLTIILAIFTQFGLVGLAVTLVGLGLLFVAQEMPSRTTKGAALLAGLGALRGELLTHPTDQMPPGHEYRELSEVLPYAVVLGGADRWLKALVDADDDETSDERDLFWYHGPEGWHMRDLPASLRNFVTTVSGSLFAR
ncbi:DUF2207 family protein [Enemella sp. A6]|uniref:DUF2207 family protein n=1 Tax=Enemella sp. A6 TaxID=3440152 RepID=UPI003EC14DF4